MSSAAIVAVLILCCYALAPASIARVAELQSGLFAHATNVPWTSEQASLYLGEFLTKTMGLVAPLLGAVVLAAILINFAQAGPIFSVKAITPDFSKLDPAAGFKRLFSPKLIYEACKSVVKLLALATVGYLAITEVTGDVMRLPSAEPKAYIMSLIDLSAGLLVKLALALLVIGMVDFAYTRWDFAKRMRMSRRDVRDEARHREGDPRVRARMRQLRAEMLKRTRSLGNVQSADVLITNPTHIAVALGYKQGSSEAPKLLAKGAGEVAAKMRQIAGQYNIPIVENKPLARVLYKEVDDGGQVPEKTYAQLAKILVWAFTMRSARRAGGAQ